MGFKYNVCFKTFLKKGVSEFVFYGDLVYKLKRNAGKHFYLINSMRKFNVIKECDIPCTLCDSLCVSGCKPNYGF